MKVRKWILGVMLLAGAVRAGDAPVPPGGNDPEARFRGAPTFDFGVSNVKWESATPEYSYVTFDLSWSHSWRVKWREPAATSCTGRDLDLESWDAAWVFVKFLPEKDGAEARERNHWRHATLDKNPASHLMPPGAMNSVKLSEDGARGMGLFIHRDAVGAGTNNWKQIKVRWNHGADKVDPAKAAVRVFPIPMVYVPQGPFKLGSGGASGIAPFPDGLTRPSAQADHMPGARDIGSLTDGSWRGGPVVPFLVDAEWNGPAASGRRARRIGAAAGQLWTTLTYVEVGVGGSNIGDPGVLGDDYPTGFEPFYCMKYDVTQGAYVDYLNALPPDVAAGRSCLGSEVRCDYPMPGGEERGGLTITVSGLPAEADATGEGAVRKGEGGGKRAAPADMMDQLIEEAERAEAARAEAAQAEAARKEKGAAPAPVAARRLPVYSARLPFRACSGISRADLYAYAIWTGMRPMSELEFEKAWRGARNPVPHENNTGTTRGERADVTKDLRDADLPTERFSRGNWAGGYGEPMTVFRVGCFATPTSDRVAANATYWGILEFGGSVVSALRRDFRGTHGDGSAPAGTPDAPLQRGNAPCAAPDDWPKRIGGRGGNDRTWINAEYIDGRFVWNRGRLVISAEHRVKPAAPVTAAPAAAPAAAAPAAGAPRQGGSIRVANVKVEPGTRDYSTVSFDLTWERSWRARWVEPAEKSITGRPLRLENRDAAWVFLKFRPAGTNLFAHGMLSTNAVDHRVPAGAVLDVGLSESATNGVGVFIYRGAPGSGANDFKNIRLRWIHPSAPRQPELKVQAIEMVYVPQGAFASKAPWMETGAVIRCANATEEWGCRDPGNPPAQDEFPNGYKAFYCAKFAISQGEYADYLNTLAPAQAAAAYPGPYGINRFTIRCDTNTGLYAADYPSRPCNFLRWSRILGYEAWAGVRPLTDLEYEKACRGPRAVARPGDAWADGLCAPAAGLGAELLPAWPEIDAGASYWGIRGLSLGGCVHEWPGIISPYNNGKGFRGGHGTGNPALPPDWPDRPALGQYGDKNMCHGAVWMTPENLSRTIALGEFLLFDNTGRYGARAARTAPFRADEVAALQLDAVPGLQGYDAAVFWLSGRFRNPGATPVKAEIVTPLPEECFVEGAAARVFTVAPGGEKPLRLLMAVTRLQAARAIQAGGVLPVQIRAVGGEVLAEQTIRVTLGQAGRAPDLRAYDGGTVEVRVLNTTDRPVPVSVTLDPAPECKPAETERRADLEAGKDVVQTYRVSRQPFPVEGLRQLPFRLKVGQGAAQNGEVTVNLVNASRWWLGRKIAGGRPGAGGAEPGDTARGADAPAANEEKAPDGMPAGLFTTAERPRRWNVVDACFTNVPLDDSRPLPSRGSSVMAATRVFAPAAREVRVTVSPVETGGDILRLWVNEAVVYDSRTAGKTGGASFPLRAGMNPLTASWCSGRDGGSSPAVVSLLFTDARTGNPVTDLVMDMEGK